MRRKPLILFTSLALAMAILVASDNLSPVSATSCAPESSKVIDGNTEYTVLQFKTVGTCTWTVPTGVTAIDYLIVAGGGGGGGRHGGGGGGGGLLSASSFDVSEIATTSVTVGVGGNGSPYLDNNSSINSTSARTQRGGDSIAFGLTANGGGAGVGKANPANASDINGGSGGGGDSSSSTKGQATGFGIGFAGGQGFNNSSGGWSGGGGGGAGSTGSNATFGVGGTGGAGASSPITGASLIYAAGGGGASESNSPGAGGSSGVGGTAGYQSNGSNGMDGRGGGGGGAGHSTVWAFKGGDGGDGIVIVRYIAPPSILKIGNDEVLSQSPVILVDPRSSSVAIPFIRLSAATDSRICVDLFTDSNKNISIELKNTSAASSFHRLAISNSATGITSSESITVNSSIGMKLTGTRSNVASMLNPSVSANESYLRLFKPDAGWVNGSVLRIRADYATASDCSGVSGSGVAMDAQIKIVAIELNQKNDVTVN